MKKTIPEWIIFFKENGRGNFNAKTMNKRRLVCGLGELVGPRKRYLLTEDEFIMVANTPLPQCHQVIGQVI